MEIAFKANNTTLKKLTQNCTENELSQMGNTELNISIEI